MYIITMFFTKHDHLFLVYLKPNDNMLMYYGVEDTIIFDNDDLTSLQTEVVANPGHKPIINIRFRSTDTRAFSFVKYICGKEEVESVCVN